MVDLESLKKRFLEKTRRSQIAFENAKSSIPGGVQGNIKFFSPYPLSFTTAEGAWMTDVDGNRYVDYLLSFGALMLGHGHQVVRQAIEEVWERYGTTSFGVPYDLELEMASTIQGLYPSIQAVRFTNSGLEATLLALRLGLAYTNKTHIAKFDGHYHGGHEQVLINTTLHGSPSKANDSFAPHADSLNLPSYYVDHTIVLPFNDLSRCDQILRKHRDEIGVVLLEPVQAGYIPPAPLFLKEIRKLTSELGIILIFDEVKTGFRVALGGAQQYYDVAPDLTALGKVLGGGFPIGAVGGRSDIMQLCSPQRSFDPSEVVFHSGTFNGNPMSLMAGLRTIQYLTRPGCFDQIVTTTNLLRHQIESLGQSHNLAIRTNGVGTIFNIEVAETSRPDSDTNFQASKFMREALDFALMYHGIFSKPFNRFSISAVHGYSEVQATLDAFDKSFSDISN